MRGWNGLMGQGRGLNNLRVTSLFPNWKSGGIETGRIKTGRIETGRI